MSDFIALFANNWLRAISSVMTQNTAVETFGIRFRIHVPSCNLVAYSLLLDDLLRTSMRVKFLVRQLFSKGDEFPPPDLVLGY